MKIVISAVAIVVLMIGAPSVQSVLANQADTEQEAGIGADKQGRPCTFGPSHDECQYQFLERIPGTPNNIDYRSGFKVGFHDELKDGIYHHSKAEDNKTASWTDGYFDGWLDGCVKAGRSADDCNIQADANTP